MRSVQVVQLMTSLVVFVGMVSGQQYLSGGLMSSPYVSFETPGSSLGGSSFGKGWMGSGGMFMNSIMSDIGSVLGPPQPFIGGGFGQGISAGFMDATPMMFGSLGGFGGMSSFGTMGGTGVSSIMLGGGGGLEGGMYPPGSFIGPAPEFMSGGDSNSAFDGPSVDPGFSRGDMSWGGSGGDPGFSAGGSSSWGQTMDPGFSFGGSNSWSSSGGMNSGFSLGSSNSWSQGGVSSASSPIY